MIDILEYLTTNLIMKPNVEMLSFGFGLGFYRSHKKNIWYYGPLISNYPPCHHPTPWQGDHYVDNSFCSVASNRTHTLLISGKYRQSDQTTLLRVFLFDLSTNQKITYPDLPILISEADTKAYFLFQNNI